MVNILKRSSTKHQQSPAEKNFLRRFRNLPKQPPIHFYTITVRFGSATKQNKNFQILLLLCHLFASYCIRCFETGLDCRAMQLWQIFAFCLSLHFSKHPNFFWLGCRKNHFLTYCIMSCYVESCWLHLNCSSHHTTTGLGAIRTLWATYDNSSEDNSCLTYKCFSKLILLPLLLSLLVFTDWCFYFNGGTEAPWRHFGPTCFWLGCTLSY